MRIIAVILLALALAACAKQELPPVQVSGPSFDASRFDCGNRPLPPDPATAGPKAGSAAARYEQRLESWGMTCTNKLGSLRGELVAAGQVAKPPLQIKPGK